MNRGDFYPAGWVERNWPKLSGLADIRKTALNSGPELMAELAGADVLYTRNPFAVSRDILAAGPKLRGVVTAAVGYEKVDVDAASELGIVVAVITTGDGKAFIPWGNVLGRQEVA